MHCFFCFREASSATQLQNTKLIVLQCWSLEQRLQHSKTVTKSIAEQKKKGVGRYATDSNWVGNSTAREREVGIFAPDRPGRAGNRKLYSRSPEFIDAMHRHYSHLRVIKWGTLLWHGKHPCMSLPPYSYQHAYVQALQIRTLALGQI